jgi:hypothetical protein
MAWHNLRRQAFQIATGICSVKESPVVDLFYEFFSGLDNYAVEKYRFIAVFTGTYYWSLFQPG